MLKFKCMKVLFSTLLVSLVCCQVILAQPKAVKSKSFFAEESMLSATLVSPMNKFLSNKSTKGVENFPARFSIKFPEGEEVSEQILVELRGHNRRENCYFPPLKLIFKKKDSSKSVLSPLKSLKLVSGCRNNSVYSQYVLKEFIAYKIYNQLTDKSFRVRLLDLNYVDTLNKKAFKNYAFLLEDVKEMAKRNDCRDWAEGRPNTEYTDRKQMLLVAMFEYMIGNTDWSVPVRHNIRTIRLKNDSLASPFSVPYDFDYAGLVNTDYAIPDPMLNTETVLQRVYRGYPRTMDELNEVIALFNSKKETIYALINNFTLLEPRVKKEMIAFLEEFYETIQNPGEVKKVFIQGART